MARYIDADAVLHAIEGMREAEWAKQQYCIPNDINAKAILDAVEATVNYEIPAADVAPIRHGEWLDFYGDYSNAECSQCGYQWEVIWEDAENVGDSMRKSMFDEFRKCYHYCPNCGAKMDGGADNG